MTSVQENKNELEAAVRYCESAISRAQATIESMEFRQQAATKSWHEQTGREAALNDRLMIATKEVEELKSEVAELEQSEQDLKQANMGLVCDNDDLKDEITELKIQLVEERERSMGYTKEIEELKSEVAELEQSEHDLKSASVETLQIALSEKDQTIALQRDQIAMFQRKMSRMNEVNR